MPPTKGQESLTTGQRSRRSRALVIEGHVGLDLRWMSLAGIRVNCLMSMSSWRDPSASSGAGRPNALEVESKVVEDAVRTDATQVEDRRGIAGLGV